MAEKSLRARERFLANVSHELRRLNKALKNAELERDILKKAVGIFSRGDGGYTDL